MNKDFLVNEIATLKEEGFFRKLKILDGANEAIEIIDGKKVINMCSNNYLGFANHPRLRVAAVAAIEKFGVGAGAVRSINGNSILHEELDRRLAIFKEEEKAHHFQSGLNCNIGVIPLITTEEDLILSDELNHASIIDGVKLSKAKKAIYRHCDMEDLEKILQKDRHSYKNVIIISDGVFSMDGNIAPLDKLITVAKKYDCLTYIDDAHGSGVLGNKGKGTVDHFSLHGQVDFIVGTLSKAIGVIGGYVAGSAALYDLINHRARPLLFSTALPPMCVAAIIEAINILEESDEHIKKLWDNTHLFQNGLRKMGFNIGKTQTPITPIHIGEESKTLKIAENLFTKGIYVSPIIYPTVRKNTARIRCMLSASHSEEHLTTVLKVFEEIKDNFNL